MLRLPHYPRLWMCPECKSKNLEWPDTGVECACGYISKPEKHGRLHDTGGESL